jgi:hypothetical protein
VHEHQEGLAVAVQPNPVHDTRHLYAKNNPRAPTFPNKSSKFAVASQAMVLLTAVREKSNGNFTPQKMIVDYSIASAFFYDDFQLVVKSILIPSYEGDQRAASKLIDICAFDLNKLIELILASGHQPNSKISYIFGEECRTFCEGE